MSNQSQEIGFSTDQPSPSKGVGTQGPNETSSSRTVGKAQASSIVGGTKGRKSNKPGSTLEILPGKRRMKGFPLSKREMEDLLSAGRESNRFFAAAGACIGFALNIAMQLKLSNVPGPDSKLWWGITVVLVILSTFLAFHGWQKQDEGRTRLSEIEDQTEHEDC